MVLKFDMAWEEIGEQTINCPEWVTTAEQAIKYLKKNFEDISVPQGVCVPGSEQLIEDSVRICNE